MPNLSPSITSFLQSIKYPPYFYYTQFPEIHYAELAHEFSLHNYFTFGPSCHYPNNTYKFIHSTIIEKFQHSNDRLESYTYDLYTQILNNKSGYIKQKYFLPKSYNI